MLLRMCVLQGAPAPVAMEVVVCWVQKPLLERTLLVCPTQPGHCNPFLLLYCNSIETIAYTEVPEVEGVMAG